MVYKHLEIENLNYGSLLKKSWELYKSKLKHILVIAIAIYAPLGIISYYINVNFNYWTALQIEGLIQQFIAIIATLAVIHIVIEPEGEWHTGLERGFKSWGYMVMTNVIALLIVTLLSILLIIPGLIWSIYYAFLAQVLVIHKLWGKEALDYSKSIVKGNWWLVLGIEILTFIILMAIIMILSLPLILLPDMAFSIIYGVVSGFIMLFLPIVNTVFFMHLDRKKHPQNKEEKETMINYRIDDNE